MIDLSVHLITYNNENHIEDTLKSILKQRCSFNFEIVVGDDCSTDKTLKIINSYELKHPTLFNIKKNDKQLGILKNFKTTLDRCKGNYIFDIAGDDIFKNTNALQKIMDVFNKNPDLGFVDSGYDKLLVNKNELIPFVNKQSIIAKKDEYKEFIFLGKVIPIGICYNKEALCKYVDFDYYIAENITIEDYPILVDLAMNTNFHKINESLLIYRIHNKSDSHKYGFKDRFNQRQQMLKLFTYFKQKYDLNKNICKTYKQTHYKVILHLAGSYEKKKLGKETFNKIESKSIYDIIHYLSSQYKLIRHLVKLRKIKNLILKK